MRHGHTNNEVTRLDLLVSPAFVACIVLLVLNDWFLKAHLHNWLTGKLSDIAGLAGVSFFICAIFPCRRWQCGALIATAFTYWKSPCSEPAIHFANSFLPFWIGRTVDYSDLLAIPVIGVVFFVAPKIRGVWTRAWMQYTLAGLSLIAFTGTTFIQTHLVRETTRLPMPQTKESLISVETGLQNALDALAARYKLDCSSCESLSAGRLYKDAEVREDSGPTGLTLMARFDRETGEFLYDIRVADLNRKPSKPERVDSLRDEIEKELRARFPAITIQRASTPTRDKTDVVAYKRHRFTSYRDAENQSDYERAMVLVKESADAFGLKRSEAFGHYYLGRLVGPNPIDREVAVSIGIADSPLIIVSIYRATDAYAELQKLLARDIEQRFRAEFGSDRARIR